MLFTLSTIAFTEKSPDAPTIGTAIAGDEEATVSFTAPSSDGGFTITSYTATSSPGDITGTLSQAGSGDITVTGLTNSTIYSFTITATNAIGTSAASSVSNTVVPIESEYEIGTYYGGGIIYYIYVSGDAGYVSGETHGLILALEDQSSGIQWYNGSYLSTGAYGTAIGTGSANTDAIIAVQGAPETSYAAGLARAYNGGGYTDWFLPSKDELNLMYLNWTLIGYSYSTFEHYWSSSEFDEENAWTHNKSLWDFDKYERDIYVRAVRAF